MSHMVIYRGADGKPGYHQTDDIHDAVSFVEQMRNEEGVEHARIFRLEEVVFEYRPYYRVELAGAGAPLDGGNGDGKAIDATTTAEVGPGSTPAKNGNGSSSDDSSSSENSNGDDVAAGGSKRGLFGR